MELIYEHLSECKEMLKRHYSVVWLNLRRQAFFRILFKISVL